MAVLHMFSLHIFHVGQPPILINIADLRLDNSEIRNPVFKPRINRALSLVRTKCRRKSSWL